MATVERTIHVVDDDEVVRDSLKILLESRGFPVTDYASGSDFFARREEGASCLLLDNHMPEMNGIEVLRRLRELGDNIVVIMITGRWDAATRAQAESLGVLAFLEKPVSHATLFGEIAKAMALASSRPATT